MLRRRLDPYHAIHSPACDKDDKDDKEKKQRQRLMKIYVLNVLFILLDFITHIKSNHFCMAIGTKYKSSARHVLWKNNEIADFQE